MMVKSGVELFILEFNDPSPFRVAAAQCKIISLEGVNWSGMLAWFL